MSFRKLSAILPLAATLFIANIAVKGGKVLVAISAVELGASPLVVGVLAALFSAVPMVLSLHLGRIVDRVDVRLPIVISTLLFVVATLSPGLAMSLATLAVASGLLGAAHIFVNLVTHNAIGRLSSDQDRAGNYGTLSVTAATATFVGPLMAGSSTDLLGVEGAFLVLTCVLFPIGCVLAFLQKPTPPVPLADRGASQGGILAMMRVPQLRRVLWTGAAVQTGTELFLFYIPVYGLSIGLSATAIGTVLSSYALAAICVRVLMGPVLRRFGRARILTATLLIAGTGYALLPLLDQVVTLCPAAMLMGAGLGIAGPLITSSTYESAPPGRTAEALGLRQVVNKTMQVTVPLGFGGLGTILGVAPVFWACSAVLIVAGGVRIATRDTSV